MNLINRIRDFFTTPNLYILFWCIAMLIQHEAVQIPYIGQISLMCALLMSIYAYTKVYNKVSIPYLKGLNQLLILFSAYGVFLIIEISEVRVSFQNQTNPTYWYLEGILKSLLPIFAFFYWTITGKLKKSHLMIWTFVFIAVSYVIYMTTYQDQQSVVDTFTDSNKTNSLAYLFIAIIPCIPLFSKMPVIQFALFAACIGMALLGMKRGAILIGVICFAWYLRCSYRNIMAGSKKVKFVLIPILTIGVIYAIMYLYNNILVDNLYFAQRIEQTQEGGSSGRDVIVEHFLNYYTSDMNIFEKLIGIGAYGTIRTYKNFAHNDWVEILICQGALGIILYIYYWIKFRATIISNKSLSSVYLILTLFGIIQFGKSFFSMSIDDMSIFSTSAVGYALGCIHLKNEGILKDEE